MDTVLRHPGDAKVTTTRPNGTARSEYEVWISDGEVVRTYASAHHLGTQRPIRNWPRGLNDPDFPGTAQVYEPVTSLPAETLPETFVHPAGYCQNVLATGRCLISGTDVIIGREVVLLDCDHPRTTELAGDRPDFHISIAVDRDTGVILHLVESIGGAVTRDAEVVELSPDVPLPPAAFNFVFPTGTTMLY
jgi:outer membrane lipoprotein-sorting protein